jgi:hypothetical protein
MDLQITATGVDRTVKDFMALRNRLASPEPVLQGDVADFLRLRMRERFASRGEGRWAPLKKNTVARKGNSRVWFDSGAAMASVTRKGAPGAKATARNGTLTFGTSIFYARFVSRRRPLIDPRMVSDHRLGKLIVDWLLAPFD